MFDPLAESYGEYSSKNLQLVNLAPFLLFRMGRRTTL